MLEIPVNSTPPLRALVCGSTQGIGRATAQLLATQGTQVTLLARNESALDDVLGELAPVTGGTHKRLVGDFSKPEELQQRVAEFIAAEGPHNILINNTGGPPGGPVHTAAPEAFRSALDMHVVCNQLLVQTLLSGMKETGYGRVVNIISTSVYEPIPNLGVSNTTRAAVAGWAKTLSKELGSFGITVNNVLPGFTATGRLDKIIDTRATKTGNSKDKVAEGMRALVPLGRFAEAEEVAAAVAFLASPAASYINGVSLPVDGGRLNSI